MSDHDGDDDDDGDDRVPLYDATLNVKPNTKKWIDQTKNMIKKFCVYEKLPYSAMDEFPTTFDYQKFLGKFVSFRQFHCAVKKLGGITPSISGVYNLMLEHFRKLERLNPTWRQPNLKKVYDKLPQQETFGCGLRIFIEFSIIKVWTNS